MVEETPVDKRGCFEPFVRRVRAKFEEGGSLSDALKFNSRAIRHDRIPKFTLNFGKLLKKPTLNALEFTTKHSIAINTATLTGICVYEWARHNGLPLPGTEVVLGPLVAAGASSSGNTINLGDGTTVTRTKEGGVITFGGKSETSQLSRGLNRKETDELFKK